MAWVHNVYWGTVCIQIGPYTGGSYLVPPSGPLEASAGEYYLVVADPAGINDLSNEGFNSGIYAGIGQDSTTPLGYYTFDDNTPVPGGWHLYIIWYDANFNDPPLNPPDPGILYAASQAAGGTRAEGERPPPPPILPANNITPQQAQVAGDLYPNAAPEPILRSYTLATAGVTWWIVRTYPRKVDPVSDASGGFAATVPNDTQLTVWRVAGLPLADVPATASVASGSGIVRVPTVPGQETYLLRILGTGERRDGLSVLGLGLIAGQKWITYTDPEWHTVPGEHTGSGHLLPGTEFYDGWVAFTGSYIETGLVSHRHNRTVVIDNLGDVSKNETGQPAGDYDGDVLTQWYYQRGGAATYELWNETQGSAHYDNALVQHYWDIELSAKAKNFVVRATDDSWTVPAPWAVTPSLPADSAITFDDRGTYQWVAEYDLEYFAISDKVRLSQSFWQERPSYGGYQMEHRWSRGKLADTTGPGYGTTYDSLGYVNPSPNHKGYSEEIPTNAIASENRDSPDVLPAEYPDRYQLDGETWWLAGIKHALQPIPDYNPNLLIGQSMGWIAKMNIGTLLLLRVPRYRFKISYIGGLKKEIPMRQRHRDDGLATDARQQKGNGSSLQSSIRRGGRTYY